MSDKFDIRESGTPLDHGVLNTPLKKRGDTLFGETRAQFEKRVAAWKRAKRQERKALITEAKALIAQVPDDRMAELGKPYRMTVKQVRKEFASMASANPAMVAQAMRKELGKCA